MQITPSWRIVTRAAPLLTDLGNLSTPHLRTAPCTCRALLTPLRLPMQLCVGSAFQRRGVGSSLLARGIAELEQPTRRGVGVDEIMLHVDPERTGACNLYRAFGFERMALMPQYYTDGRAALLMRRLRPR